MMCSIEGSIKTRSEDEIAPMTVNMGAYWVLTYKQVGTNTKVFRVPAIGVTVGLVLEIYRPTNPLRRH